MEDIKEKRIGVLMFRKASYLCEEPEYPSWDIEMFYPNQNYGKENEYNVDETGEWYYKDNPHVRTHKSCFKYKECCYTIASFNYDSHEGFYELHFICDRPICLNEEEQKIFWELFKYGNSQLNHKDCN